MKTETQIVLSEADEACVQRIVSALDEIKAAYAAASKQTTLPVWDLEGAVRNAGVDSRRIVILRGYVARHRAKMAVLDALTPDQREALGYIDIAV